MDLGIKGKNALVIASSQGLGKAVAMVLAKEGANVMITSRHEEKLQQVQKELQEVSTGKIAYCVCDITKPADIEELVARTHEELGDIHILLNNAGGPPSGGFEEFNDEAWQNAFELNLLSYIRIIRAVLPDMKKLGWGRIANVASISVKQPIANLILSNTFRNGIVGLSKTLSDELGPENILVNVLAPGQIATGRIKELNEARAEKQGISVEEVEQGALKNIPVGRLGTPEEFGKAAAFLLSEANNYITGSTVLVDGGMARTIS